MTDERPGGAPTSVAAWTPSQRQQDRDAYRRSRARRSTWVAFASTAVLAVVAVLAIRATPGWPRVKESFFDPEVAKASLPRVAEGLWLNIRVMAVCAVAMELPAALGSHTVQDVPFECRSSTAAWTAWQFVDVTTDRLPDRAPEAAQLLPLLFATPHPSTCAGSAAKAVPATTAAPRARAAILCFMRLSYQPRC